MPIFDEYFLDQVLNLLNVGVHAFWCHFLKQRHHLARKLFSSLAVSPAHSHGCSINGIGDALRGERHNRTIALNHMRNLSQSNLLLHVSKVRLVHGIFYHEGQILCAKAAFQEA